MEEDDTSEHSSQPASEDRRLLGMRPTSGGSPSKNSQPTTDLPMVRRAQDADAQGRAEYSRLKIRVLLPPLYLYVLCVLRNP